MILERQGHYRKTGDKEKALENSARALELLRVLDYEKTLSAGTTYVNTATAHSAFGEYARAAELFEKARAVYEGPYLENRPELLGGALQQHGLNWCTIEGFCEGPMPFVTAATWP